VRTEAEDRLARSRKQFGATAEAYRTSPVFRHDVTLARMLELAAAPQPDERALDIATGAGHTAVAFAPHMREVVATDPTLEMLAQTRLLAAECCRENVTLVACAAEALPFAEGTFGIVTCRIAPHHFTDVSAFCRESARVLRPGGRFVVCDTVAPEARDADEWMQEVERLRDPSHGRDYTRAEWLAFFDAAGFTDPVAEWLPASEGPHMDTGEWLKRAKVSAEHTARILALYAAAPASARAEFLIEEQDGEFAFAWPRLILAAARPAA
jgi:ubiquinone/menaquinone biosynthesis C-methylase UbiE